MMPSSIMPTTVNSFFSGASGVMKIAGAALATPQATVVLVAALAIATFIFVRELNTFMALPQQTQPPIKKYFYNGISKYTNEEIVQVYGRYCAKHGPNLIDNDVVTQLRARKDQNSTENIQGYWFDDPVSAE